MNIINNGIVMKHCPHCDSVCLVSKADIDAAQAADKSVCISCHQCEKEFAIDSYHAKNIKIARPANLKLIICSSCKKQVTLPDPLPDRSIVELFCPFCDGKIDDDDQKSEGELSNSAAAKLDLEKADISPKRQANQSRKSATSYVPLYVLAILCLGAFLFWATETGHLPVDALPFDQWFKILE